MTLFEIITSFYNCVFILLHELQKWMCITRHSFVGNCKQTVQTPGLFTRTTLVSWHQKGSTNLDFNEAREDEVEWHQLDHMQIICTSLHTDNNASIPSLNIYRLDALPATQPTV